MIYIEDGSHEIAVYLDEQGQGTLGKIRREGKSTSWVFEPYTSWITQPEMESVVNKLKSLNK